MNLKEEMFLNSQLSGSTPLITIQRAEEIAEAYTKEKAIEFAKWYSGMDQDKVISAYERFLKEKKETK